MTSPQQPNPYQPQQPPVQPQAQPSQYQSAYTPQPQAAPQYQQQPPQYQQPAPQYGQPVRSTDTGSFGWAVLGFFLPVVGLILWLVWKDEKPLNARKAGMGALVGVITIIALYVLMFLFAFIIAAGASSIHY